MQKGWTNFLLFTDSVLFLHLILFAQKILSAKPLKIWNIKVPKCSNETVTYWYCWMILSRYNSWILNLPAWNMILCHKGLWYMRFTNTSLVQRWRCSRNIWVNLLRDMWWLIGSRLYCETESFVTLTFSIITLAKWASQMTYSPLFHSMWRPLYFFTWPPKIWCKRNVTNGLKLSNFPKYAKYLDKKEKERGLHT